MNRKRVMCRWGSLAVGCGGLALAFWGLTHASRLPGAVGETLRHNLASGREVTAIFYTELGDWWALAAEASQAREAGGRASVPTRKSGDRFSGARRPAGKARRPSISGIFEEGATKPDGMPCPENVSGFPSRDTSGAAENIAPGTPARSGCAPEGNSRRRVSRRCD